MNYPYTSGIVKSLENKLLSREKLIKIKRTNADEFVKSLKELDYGNPNATNLEELIRYEMKKVKDLIEELSPDSKLTNLFFLEQDDLNIKLLYKKLLFGVSSDSLLTDLGSIKEKKIKKIILGNDLSDLSKQEEKLFKELSQFPKESISSKDLSIWIDKKVYEYALLCCHSNSILLKYYKQKIDNSNIMMMIRNKILNWSKEQFLSMIISKGNISKEVFEKIYELDDEKLLKEIADSCDEKVVKVLKKYFANKEFYKLENDLEQLLIEKISETKNDALNIGPLLYYYVAKNSEIKNIRMLYSNANVQINDLLAY